MKELLLNTSGQIGHKAGRKTVAIMLMVSALMLSPSIARSQVLLDEENYGSPRATTNGVIYEFEIIPFGGGDGDQFLPLGEGWLLLGGFGAAYLLAKRRKQQED